MHQNKEEILMHYENSIEWVKNLENLTEEQWRTPIAEGKWTIAEVIGHIPAWDQFILDKRLPYLFNKQSLPKQPEENVLNHQSSLESKTKTKQTIISKFIKTRRSLIISVNNIADELWEKQFNINQKTLTVSSYLKDLVEHDEHHFNEIREVLKAF